jgi:hypothetical protein
LLRKRNLVPGHVKHTKYRISRDIERAIWRRRDVQRLPRLEGHQPMPSLKRAIKDANR